MPKALTALCVLLLFLGGCFFLGTDRDTAFYALIVGIDLYDDPLISDLSYCKADANGMRAMLLQHGWDDGEITLLLDSEATKSAILSAVESMAQAAFPGDYLFIFYSGHGSYVTDTSGDESDGTDEAIVPVDFDTGDLSTLLLDDELGSALSGCRTEKGVFIFDSCNSGGFIASFFAEGTGARVRYHDIGGARGTGSNGDLDIVNIPVMTASGEYEYSTEDSLLEHGVFTYFLLEGLTWLSADKNSDGHISIRELFDYAEIHTKYYTMRFQNPQLLFSRKFLDILITR
ncbi:MAG: caspase family protein [Spirochaetes bacterium]|nr:caspase family protein [Spirochaetota bacterium]